MNRRLRAGAVCGAGVGLALALVLVSDRHVGIYDEGCILQGAALMLDGAVPHRDFYTNYGPGQFVAVALLFKAFGASVWVERMWDASVRASCVLLLFLGARRAAGAAAAAGLGAIAAIWLAGLPNVHGYPVFPALAAVLGAALLLTGENCGARSRDVGAGLCLGVAALFRIDIGLACFGAAAGVITGQAWLARDRHGWPRAARVTAGFLCPLVPMLLWFSATGALPAVWFDVVVFPAHYYVRMRSLPFPGVGDVVDDPSLMSAAIPPVLCALAVPVMWRAAGRDGASPGRALCPLLLTTVLYAKGWVRISPVHVSAGLVMSLLLTAELVALRARWIMWAAIPALVVCTAGGLVAEAARGAGNLAWLVHAAWLPPVPTARSGYDTCRPPANLRRDACLNVPADRAAAIAFVQAHAPAGAAIFVGLPRHDRMLANDVAFAFEAARRPATNWYDFNPGLQTSRMFQQAIITDLRRAKPPVIVIEDVFQNYREPNESVTSSGVRDLDDYIARHYRRAAAFGRYRVLEPDRAG